MVRNVTGGNKTKGMSRKELAVKETNHFLRIPEPDEILAVAQRRPDGNHFKAKLENGVEITVYMRNKFSGKNKKDNFIDKDTFVLIAQQSFATAKGKERYDLLEVYSDSEIMQLRSNTKFTGVIENLFPIKGDADDIFDHTDSSYTDTKVKACAGLMPSTKVWDKTADATDDVFDFKIEDI